MGRSSGFFETLVKSSLGFGTTVHYQKDWLGRREKVVKHHDSGKERSYKHDRGVWGNKTITETKQHGQTTEKGEMKSHFFGGATEHAEKTDGTKVRREYRPGLFKDHATEYVDGECFKCEGSGKKILTCSYCDESGQQTLTCSFCKGSGKFQIDPKPCPTCNGTGKFQGVATCRHCLGSGEVKAASEVKCLKCGGTGQRKRQCIRCAGRKNVEVTCNRCNGSGTYTKSTVFR